jgi:cysteine desulfurase/selenocysteine lyase
MNVYFTMTIDVKKIKKDFPILKRKVHDKKLIYLDNVATTQKPQIVIDAISNYYETSNANIHRGAYLLSEESSEIYENTKKVVAEFINANSWEEIIYTRNTTESINLVSVSLYCSGIIKEGDTILTSRMEHHSNLIPWLMMRDFGINVEFIELTKTGELDYEDFEKKLKKFKPALVSVTHISNVLGTINDVKKITKKAHEIGSLVLIDGAQSAPNRKIDMKKIGADFYAFSAHKMLGPFGIGVLYGKKEILEKMDPFLTGGDMVGHVSFDKVTWNTLPWKFEAGTANVAGAVGLASAIKYLENIGMDNITKHEEELISYAINELTKIGCVIYGPKNPKKRAGLISFNFKNTHPHDLASILDLSGISIRSGHHCAESLMNHLEIDGTARAGFYIYNSKEDVDELIKGLKKAKKIFKIK